MNGELFLRSVAWGALVLVVGASRGVPAGNPERGKTVFTLAAGCSCHTSQEGPVGAGGGEVPTPFGTFYGPNITPDVETGIGSWTTAEIDAAIRGGWVKGKGAEAPAMPYYRYAGMAAADARDLIAYLRSLPPVRRPNRPHEVRIPLARWAYRGWRLLFFRRPVPPTTAPPAGAARGRYLVDHVAICGDCHTPRNRLGAPNHALYLAGTTHGPDGRVVPNITPDPTGIGDWDTGDIVNLLTLGMMPNFDNVQGLMATVVDGKAGGPGYARAPQRDLRAIAEYLKSVPPIDNVVDDK
ncbi:MAG: c-type cytochrome [Candidatus Binatia bacterium]